MFQVSGSQIETVSSAKYLVVWRTEIWDEMKRYIIKESSYFFQ